MNTRELTIRIDTGLSDRYALLDRRDEITDKLAELGLRISATVSGDELYLVDPAQGVPTLGELLTGNAEPHEIECDDADELDEIESDAMAAAYDRR